MAVGRAGPTLGSLLLHTIPSLPCFSSARELRQWWFSFPEVDALGDALSQKVFAAFARRPWWGIWCKDLPNFAVGAGDREVTSSLAPALSRLCWDAATGVPAVIRTSTVPPASKCRV